MIEGVGIYWGAWGLAWNGVILAFVITAIWGYHLFNRRSLHHLCERRIQRTWVMGAKPQYRPGSQGVPNPDHGWSRVWVRPDIKMRDLKTRRATAPYHLICTTLNIPGSTGPKLLDRKGDSFVIGAVYSGSALTRWEPTESLEEIADMPLARATISAAAVSPNMGAVTSTTLSVVTTLFNLRLGWWVANPLGVYELLRRRCKYIIAVDGTGESPDPWQFDTARHPADEQTQRQSDNVEARPHSGEHFSLGPRLYSKYPLRRLRDGGQVIGELRHNRRGTHVGGRRGSGCVQP